MTFWDTWTNSISKSKLAMTSVKNKPFLKLSQPLQGPVPRAWALPWGLSSRR